MLRNSSLFYACLGLVVVLSLWSCGSNKSSGFDTPGQDSGTIDQDAGTIGDDGGLNLDSSMGDSGTPSADCDDTSCMAAGGMCTNKVCVIVDNPGHIDPATQGTLKGGGTADSAFKWLYPYDKTVFPRGLLPPTLQFGGNNPTSMYVHITFPGLDYSGFFGSSSPGRVTFSKPVWTAITLAAKAQSDVKVDVTKISGGQVTGPITEHWTIAQGSLRGAIYYETYDSPMAGGVGSVGLMRIDPGATAPTVLKSGCGNVCHTASADGSTLVASTAFPAGSSSYDLRNNVATLKAQPDNSFTYAALYPDGTFAMSATSYRTWLGNFPSKLWDTRTGTTIAAPGWDGVITNAGTAAFSPDGKHIAFNHLDTGGTHTLAAMDFNVATKTFSNLADIATDNARTLAWPAFTPDAKWVVYHAGSNAQFETDNNATGDLFIVDLATKTVKRLDSLDGYSGGASYLPDNDPNLNFAPTVLPVAVGGYFWVVFTSHRGYGNTLATKFNNDQDGHLWVAAIDLNAAPGTDPSHPAFYLDGQEANADNLRGFWVLSPCKATGQSCQTGDECCQGFCRPNGDGGALACVPPPGGCSNEYEKCTTAADCCNKSQSCINGRCAQPPPR